MTNTAVPVALLPASVERALVRAAARAMLAPSVHNTQPWRFVARPGRLDVYRDRYRGAPVVDPGGRQLVVSCGAAVFGARVALAAVQLDVVTTLVPDAEDPDRLATLTVVGAASAPDEDARRLDAAAEQRHSNRRHFSDAVVPEPVMDVLTRAVAVEGAWLQTLHDLTDRVTLASLCQHADSDQKADPAYLAELLKWTTDDTSRLDGVPSFAVPDSTGPAYDDIPIRDFDTRGHGELPAETRSSIEQTLVVLGTSMDRTRDWLMTGQALGRLLLELTSAGYVASIISQVVENPRTREQLRHELRLPGSPQLVLRIGAAEPTPATPRRGLADVLTVDFVPSPFTP